MWPVVGAAMSESTTSGCAAQRLGKLLRRLRVEKIHQQHRRARHRIHFEIVDADDMRIFRRRPRARRGDLAPAAGRRTEVDDLHAGLQQMMLVVDLDQLVGRARPVAVGLGALDIGIVDVALAASAATIPSGRSSS